MVRTSEKTPVETPVKTSVMILRVLTANPSMSLTEVAREISKSVRAVERASTKLVKEGKLKRIGPTKGGHWEVLTPDDQDSDNNTF